MSDGSSFEFTFSDDDDEKAVALDSDEPTGLHCDICGREDFKNEGGLKRHRTVTHGMPSATADSAPKGRAKSADLEKELVEFFGTIGMLVSMVDQVDGMVLVQNAERNAAAWAHLAQTNKTVDRVIRQVLTTSAIGEVVTATIITAVPIMAHHGMLPEEMFQMFAQPPMPPSEEGLEGSGND